MALAVKQYKAVDTTAALGNSPISITFDSAVDAGSLLVLAGVALGNDAYDYSNLSSVSDTRSNTWQSPINRNASGSPSVFYSYAMNATSGTTTISASMSVSTNNRYGIVAFEVTGAKTASAFDLTVGGSSTASATTVSTATSAALAQADNFVILVGGGAFGIPSNTAGYTQYLSIANGGTKIGTQVMARIVSSTSALTGTVNHELTTNNRHAILAVFKAASVTAKKVRITTGTSQIAAGDGPVSVEVWRNTNPRTDAATYYVDGITPGTDYVDLPGIPQTWVNADTITAIVYNGTKTTGYVAGTVMDA